MRNKKGAMSRLFLNVIAILIQCLALAQVVIAPGSLGSPIDTSTTTSAQQTQPISSVSPGVYTWFDPLSSFALQSGESVVEANVSIKIDEFPPNPNEFYFWGLVVQFSDSNNIECRNAWGHIGLQWVGNEKRANWGGGGSGDGTGNYGCGNNDLSLQKFNWEVGHTYEYFIYRGSRNAIGDYLWEGTIKDTSTNEVVSLGALPGGSTILVGVQGKNDPHVMTETGYGASCNSEMKVSWSNLRLKTDKERLIPSILRTQYTGCGGSTQNKIRTNPPVSSKEFYWTHEIGPNIVRETSGTSRFNPGGRCSEFDGGDNSEIGGDANEEFSDGSRRYYNDNCVKFSLVTLEYEYPTYCGPPDVCHMEENVCTENGLIETKAIRCPSGCSNNGACCTECIEGATSCIQGVQTTCERDANSGCKSWKIEEGVHCGEVQALERRFDSVTVLNPPQTNAQEQGITCKFNNVADNQWAICGANTAVGGGCNAQPSNGNTQCTFSKMVDYRGISYVYDARLHITGSDQWWPCQALNDPYLASGTVEFDCAPHPDLYIPKISEGDTYNGIRYDGAGNLIVNICNKGSGSAQTVSFGFAVRNDEGGLVGDYHYGDVLMSLEDPIRCAVKTYPIADLEMGSGNTYTIQSKVDNANEIAEEDEAFNGRLSLPGKYNNVRMFEVAIPFENNIPSPAPSLSTESTFTSSAPDTLSDFLAPIIDVESVQQTASPIQVPCSDITEKEECNNHNPKCEYQGSVWETLTLGFYKGKCVDYVGEVDHTMTLKAGWHLFGVGLDNAKNKNALKDLVQCGNADHQTGVATVWMWSLQGDNQWYFRAPNPLQNEPDWDCGKAYAEGKGYKFLDESMINGLAETAGMWINLKQDAKIEYTTSINSEEGNNVGSLHPGWNLVSYKGLAEGVDPYTLAREYSLFNKGKIITIWAINESCWRWDFAAPAANEDVERDYRTDKNFLPLRKIKPGIGYWINVGTDESSYTPDELSIVDGKRGKYFENSNSRNTPPNVGAPIGPSECD